MARTYSTHVVIGAGGAITKALVPQLVREKQKVIVVSRRGAGMSGAQGVSADATDYEALSSCVPDQSVVYLLVGLAYDSRVWQVIWPKIMENVIRVCREKGALLVFLDNVYMYGLVKGPMTEETPNRPVSRKGEIRARIADRLMAEYSSGRIQGMIARSADFYGPGAEKTGVPNLLIIDNLMKGKAAQWLANADRVHSLTYTADCGRALPLMVADESAYNQIWHLPTAKPALTMRQFAGLAAKEIEVKAKMSVLPPFMVGLAGLFDRTIRELYEMLYQNANDYLFDSSKFENHFSVSATPYADGIAETVRSYRL
ncbi:MAG TPA: NAD-dependent epimerase/dehydratase family protein [Spirochaetia bacterium]|nr:NAD-dependent epimerase/dehydratase family protein [Spirochaetia bacterium]